MIFLRDGPRGEYTKPTIERQRITESGTAGTDCQKFLEPV